MELDAIRKFVQDHPDVVPIRMVDGRTHPIPHRDWIAFGPPAITLSDMKAPEAPDSSCK